MEVEIWTSDADAVDPAEVARLLEKHGNFYVHSVTINDNERTWTEDD